MVYPHEFYRVIRIIRLKSRGLYPIEESSIDAGLLYLLIAGMWMVVYRLGIQPFDYGETIILLTVIHFHFAAFAALIIAGMSGRVLATRKHPQQVFKIAVFAMVAAMPLVAAGITFSAWLGLIGTVLLSAGLVMLAVLNVGWVLPAVQATSTRLLLLIGALCSCSAMVLACLYAYSLPMENINHRHPDNGPDARRFERLRLCGLLTARVANSQTGAVGR